MALNVFDTLDDVTNVANQLGFLMVPQGVELYYPKAEAKCSLIVMPYTTTCCPVKGIKPGQEFYMRDYWVYRGLGANQKGSYLDHHKSFGERCAITDSLQTYDGDPKKKPKSQRKALVNVLLIEDGKVRHGILDHSFANFLGRLLEDIKDRIDTNPEKYEHLQYFADATEGVRIDFKWKEETLNGHKFYVAGAFDYTEHKGKYVSDFRDKAVDLDKCFAKLTYKQVQSMYLGEAVDDDQDAEEPSAPMMGVKTEEVVKEPEAEKPQTSKASKPKTTKAVTPQVEARDWAVEASKLTKGQGVTVAGKEYTFRGAEGDIVRLLDESTDEVSKHHMSVVVLTTAAPVATKPAPKAEKPKAEPKAEPKSASVPEDTEAWDNWGDE